jgi:type II secretory pathway pseudopilin PulG
MAIRMRSGRRGFSILDMLFAVVILAVVSGGTFTLFYANVFGADLSGDQSTAMVDAQAALRSIAADFRPGSAFTTPTNTGGVRATYSSGSPVEYYQSGTSLYRLVDSTTPATTALDTALASGTGMTLTYYDSSLNAIAGPMDSTKYGQAAAVDVKITTRLSHSVFGTVSRTTRVLLRNKVS